jgi:hypothetical protein
MRSSSSHHLLALIGARGPRSGAEERPGVALAPFSAAATACRDASMGKVEHARQPPTTRWPLARIPWALRLRQWKFPTTSSSYDVTANA